LNETVLNVKEARELWLPGFLHYPAVNIIIHTNINAIEKDFFDNVDIHVHVPADAIPKDGPSTGIAIATAIVSALTGRPVKKEIAMTGEVTLSGLVLPVGGIREKVLAARREGIKRVILPARNRLDVKEIPRDLVKGIRFSFIENIEEAVDLALT